MEESPGWKETKAKMWARIKEIEKYIPNYDYSERHHMMATDERMTDIIHDELRKSKKTLFSTLEVSYERQRESLVKDLKKMRDEIDAFLDRVKVKHVKWPESIPEDFLEKIVVHDSEILRELPRLNSELEEIRKMLMSIDGQDLSDREQLTRLNNKIMDVKGRVNGLVSIFKEREMLLNLRHSHKEHDYDEVRGGAETTF
jgi:predicted nuclease with TOPRIM domain